MWSNDRLRVGEVELGQVGDVDLVAALARLGGDAVAEHPLGAGHEHAHG